VFLLSGGGKFNYQGTKRWIEDNMENAGNHNVNCLLIFFFFFFWWLKYAQNVDFTQRKKRGFDRMGMKNKKSKLLPM
jgi:hypothetical protein